MMIEEFEQRTGYFPSSAEYKAIEAAYMEFDGDKDEFCKAYKKNANGIAERIRREANAAAFKESRQHTADLTRRDIEIERLKKQLEREQEWKPYEDADAVSQADYDELAASGGMTIDDIAAGIRWHYERGTNALADDDTLTQARADIEAARQQAAEAGLPFSERLVEGPEDEINPYTYDGSMTAADYEAAQRARDAHAALVEVVADHYPNATEEAVERVAEAASSMKLSPEAVQRILDAFDNIIEAINRMIEWAAQAIRTLADFFGETLDNFILRRVPPKWRHYALHAKRARVRKKYRNRIRRAFFAALASEGGGSS